jgi:hypothetical protein
MESGLCMNREIMSALVCEIPGPEVGGRGNRGERHQASAFSNDRSPGEITLLRYHMSVLLRPDL